MGNIPFSQKAICGIVNVFRNIWNHDDGNNNLHGKLKGARLSFIILNQINEELSHFEVKAKSESIKNRH